MVDQPYSSKQLSDSTPIAGMKWGELKEEAMKEDYEGQHWYLTMSEDDKELLEALRKHEKKNARKASYKRRYTTPKFNKAISGM